MRRCDLLRLAVLRIALVASDRSRWPGAVLVGARQSKQEPRLASLLLCKDTIGLLYLYCLCVVTHSVRERNYSVSRPIGQRLVSRPGNRAPTTVGSFPVGVDRPSSADAAAQGSIASPVAERMSAHL